MSNYHDIPALSASGINKWWNYSPYHYWKESPFNPDRVKQNSTPAMAFGTLCHTLVFEAQKVAELIAVKPSVDKRTKEGKELHAEFDANLGDRTAVSMEQYESAMRMMNQVKMHKGASRLLQDCIVEEPIFWEDEITRKAKLDAFKEGLILDYKTGANIDWNNLGSYICKMGYHRQAAYYREAFKQRHGVFPDGVVFIFQDSDFPDIIAMCSMADIGLDIGISENEEAAADIAHRLKTGDWLPSIEIKEALPPAWKIQQHYNREANRI